MRDGRGKKIGWTSFGVGRGAVDCIDLAALGFAIGFHFFRGRDGALDFSVGNDLFWLGLFALEALEVGRGDLQRVENQAGFFIVDSVLEDEFNNLLESDLD